MSTCVSTCFADEGERKKVVGLGRTFSADMSSKTWSVETGFSQIKRIVPDVVDSLDGREVVEKDEKNRPSQIDIWTSILSQKNDSHSSVPPPYVHPLVKRSTSLSKKSLEICTESLGSETGSDVFSSHPTSEGSDEVKIENEKSQPLLIIEEKLPQIVDTEEVHVLKYNCAYHNNKSSGPKSFPPPLPSLAHQGGASFHMHSRRENGRLALVAVSIPTQNNFHAQRRDGRLLLTFVSENKSDVPEVDEKYAAMDKPEDDHKKVFKEMAFGQLYDKEGINKDGVVSDESEDGELEEVNTDKNMTVKTQMVAASGVINVHRPTFVVNNVIRLTSRNTSIWTNKFNKVVKVELQAEEEATNQLDPNSLARSVTSQPRLSSLISSSPPSITSAMAAAASTFNAYDYCWRRKSTSVTTIVSKTSPNDSPPSSAPISKNHNLFLLTKTVKDSKHHDEEKMPTNFLVLKGKRGEGEFIVPYFRGCKDQKRSLLFRETCCITTS